jgi:hypothetical protein
MTHILSNRREWFCPNCKLEDVTNEARPHSRFHVCPKLRGLTAPMLPKSMDAKVTVHEREDYVGTEDVFRDAEGRPIMSIVTTRADGTNDAMVFAPTAHLRGDT